MFNALFSGRFDPPNLGHVMTIQRLLLDYRKVIVPILWYNSREACSAELAQKIFETHFDMVLPQIDRWRVKFLINKEHFGKITEQELMTLLRTVDVRPETMTYVGGNEPVLAHVATLGVNTRYIPRVHVNGLDPYVFESTKIRQKIARGETTIPLHYNI